MLCDGKIVGAWRPRKKGTTLRLDVGAYEILSNEDMGRIGKEVDPRFRTAPSAEVTLV